ncbi:hypothetical protein RBH20_19595 [Haloarcula sp. H-GB4]|uniref:hypothetical protein n=1 Tax=Haloarcula sp. H-GB4 TaxID=3069755 RepID=UPI0027AF7803|nr:hypothetical protein [Haloarcula sp. H-GB4]MDQ2074735.1 hypothetical protein [Haloarcula sp. H-GB4]
MAQVPSEFGAEFEAKTETFFRTAELLYANPGRQYTQQELSDRFDCSVSVRILCSDFVPYLFLVVVI